MKMRMRVLQAPFLSLPLYAPSLPRRVAVEGVNGASLCLGYHPIEIKPCLRAPPRGQWGPRGQEAGRLSGWPARAWRGSSEGGRWRRRPWRWICRPWPRPPSGSRPQRPIATEPRGAVRRVPAPLGTPWLRNREGRAAPGGTWPACLGQRLPPPPPHRRRPPNGQAAPGERQRAPRTAPRLAAAFPSPPNGSSAG